MLLDWYMSGIHVSQKRRPGNLWTTDQMIDCFPLALGCQPPATPHGANKVRADALMGRLGWTLLGGCGGAGWGQKVHPRLSKATLSLSYRDYVLDSALADVEEDA